MCLCGFVLFLFFTLRFVRFIWLFSFSVPILGWCCWLYGWRCVHVVLHTVFFRVFVSFSFYLSRISFISLRFWFFFSCVLLFLYGANCLSLHFTRCNHTRLLNSHCNAMGYMCVLSYWCSHYSAPYLWLWLCSEIFVAISRSLSLSTSLFLCSYYAFIIISSLFYELRITLLALLHRVLFVFCFGLFACMLIFATTVCGLSRSSVMRVKEWKATNEREREKKTPKRNIYISSSADVELWARSRLPLVSACARFHGEILN